MSLGTLMLGLELEYAERFLHVYKAVAWDRDTDLSAIAHGSGRQETAAGTSSLVGRVVGRARRLDGVDLKPTLHST